MKKIFLFILLLACISCNAQTGLKICQLPETNKMSNNGWFVYEDSTCSNGTRKISIEDVVNALDSLGIENSGSTDTSHLSARINLKVDSIKLNSTKDTVSWYQNGVKHFAYVIPGSSGGAGQVRYYSAKTGRDTSDVNFYNDPYEAQILKNSVIGGFGLLTIDTNIIQLQYNNVANAGAGINIDNGGFTLSNFGVNWSWPHADGTNGQVQFTDGAGNLNFKSVIDSVRRKIGTDTVQMKINGTWLFAFIDSIGSGGGSGITSLTIASSNGFTGSSSGGSTPALTLSTSVTGLLKGNGTAISAATVGTDYVTGSSTNTFTNKSGNVSQWTNDAGYLTTALQWTDTIGRKVDTRFARDSAIAAQIAAIGTPVLTSRTLTINGSTQDLSANRTWSVGTLVGSDTAALRNAVNSKANITDTLTYMETIYKANKTRDSLAALIATTSAPANEILFGTGTGTASDSSLIYDQTKHQLLIKDHNGADPAIRVLNPTGGDALSMQPNGAIYFDNNGSSRAAMTVTQHVSQPTAVFTGGTGVGIGNTSPASMLSVGTGNQFQVDANGNIVFINNVPYSWPTSNSLGQLTNDASGNLTWVAPIFNNYTATSDPDIGNDNTQGYSKGSEWENTITELTYKCVNSSTGAAHWRLITIGN